MRLRLGLVLLATTLLAFCLVAGPAFALRAPSGSADAKSAKVTVSGSQQWVDTGMDVQSGDKLHITAKGTVDIGKNAGITANGAQRGWVDTLLS